MTPLAVGSVLFFCFLASAALTIVTEGCCATQTERVIKTIAFTAISFGIIIALVVGASARCPNNDCYCRNDICITPVPTNGDAR